MSSIRFEAVYKNEQWIVDNLLKHLRCSDIKIRLSKNKRMLQLYCEDCE